MEKLPEKYEEKNMLKNMRIGESGYTVPWAMWADLSGSCWLNEDYTFYEKTGGTVQLKITRVEGGYIAHIHEIKDDYKWQKQEKPGYMSRQEVCYGRVVGFSLTVSEVAAISLKKASSPIIGLFKQIWN